MPSRAKRPCGHMSCPALVSAGDGPLCPDHKRKRTKSNNEHRERRYDGSMYGARWRKARRVYLGRNPWCVAAGCPEPANEVDHIVPHRGDTKVFWDRSNWQALCKSCHSSKTMSEIMDREEVDR